MLQWPNSEIDFGSACRLEGMRVLVLANNFPKALPVAHVAAIFAALGRFNSNQLFTELVGSMLYMAPEMGIPAYDCKVDMCPGRTQQRHGRRSHAVYMTWFEQKHIRVSKVRRCDRC